MVNKPCCIDLYHGNEVSDSPTPLAGLDRAKASGVFILIHKATEGTVDRDQRYDARRTKWMAGASVPIQDVDGQLRVFPPKWGGYHFFHGNDPAGEAKNFLMTARLSTGDMPWLDWEAVGASGFQPSIEAADAFCEAVEQALGRVCGIYGGNVPRERFAAEKVSSAVLERFSKRPLWFCAYGPEKELTLLPEPWKETGCLLWQDDGDRYGPGPHSIPGITGYTDNSTVVAPMTFIGLNDKWLELSGAGTPPAPVAAAPTHEPSNLEKIEAELQKDLEIVEDKIEEELKGDKKS
jgi:hypothetical protein